MRVVAQSPAPYTLRTPKSPDARSGSRLLGFCLSGGQPMAETETTKGVERMLFELIRTLSQTNQHLREIVEVLKKK